MNTVKTIPIVTKLSKVEYVNTQKLKKVPYDNAQGILPEVMESMVHAANDATHFLSTKYLDASLNRYNDLKKVIGLRFVDLVNDGLRAYIVRKWKGRLHSNFYRAVETTIAKDFRDACINSLPDGNVSLKTYRKGQFFKISVDSLKFFTIEGKAYFGLILLPETIVMLEITSPTASEQMITINSLIEKSSLYKTKAHIQYSSLEHVGIKLDYKVITTTSTEKKEKKTKSRKVEEVKQEEEKSIVGNSLYTETITDETIDALGLTAEDIFYALPNPEIPQKVKEALRRYQRNKFLQTIKGLQK